MANGKTKPAPSKSGGSSGPRRSVDYGKISGAISGRSMAMIDPTIEIKRKAKKAELERQSDLAIVQGISAVVGAGASLVGTIGSNLESWGQMESGMKAVGGAEATLKTAGADPGILKRAFTAAPSGGQMALTQGDKTRIFSGTELSGIGKAVEGGYQSTLTEPGSSLFESYGGSLKMAEAGPGDYAAGLKGQIKTSTGATIGTDPYWNPKGTFEVGEWGVSSPSKIGGIQTLDDSLGIDDPLNVGAN